MPFSKAVIRSSYGNPEFFGIVAGDTLAPYLFIIYLV